MLDLQAGHEALRHDVGGLWLARDVVTVNGPGAVMFLQGQCSQDVAVLGIGDSAWSWVLQPQGKVEALVRVTRVAEDAMILDTDGGWGEALMARLNRFKLRVKADIAALDWKCLALRGPGVKRLWSGGQAGSGEVLALDAGWPGVDGLDLIGADVVAPDGVAIVDPDAFEAARICAGVPRMGAELTEKTIPNETGLIERTVSFTKGCYTGQELVARIDSRGGKVPRNLRGLVLAAPAPVGAAIVIGGKKVGALTSVAPAPSGDGAVALAYIGRDVEAPADAEVNWDGGATVGGIRYLPMELGPVELGPVEPAPQGSGPFEDEGPTSS